MHAHPFTTLIFRVIADFGLTCKAYFSSSSSSHRPVFFGCFELSWQVWHLFLSLSFDLISMIFFGGTFLNPKMKMLQIGLCLGLDCGGLMGLIPWFSYVMTKFCSYCRICIHIEGGREERCV